MQRQIAAIVVLAVLAAILVSTIMRLHHFAHRGMRYLAYATGGAALMCLVVPFVLYQSGFYLGLNFSPQFFYHFGVSLVAYVLKLCMLGGMVHLTITVILLVLISMLRRETIRHRQKGTHSLA